MLKQMEISTLTLPNFLEICSVAKDAHSVVLLQIILHIHMATVMVQEEEDLVEEEDTKKLSKHLPEQVLQLAKANHKPVQVPIIQPIIGKEL